jgi:hypothetical protein
MKTILKVMATCSYSFQEINKISDSDNGSDTDAQMGMG